MDNNTIVINGVTAEHNFTNTEFNSVTKEMENFLHRYGYDGQHRDDNRDTYVAPATFNGCAANIREWEQEKKGLIGLLECSEHYKEGKYYTVSPIKVSRGLGYRVVRDFAKWAEEAYFNSLKDETYNYLNMSYSDLLGATEKVSSILTSINVSAGRGCHITVNGMPKSFWDEEFTRLSDAREEAEAYDEIWWGSRSVKVSRETKAQWIAVLNFFEKLKGANTATLTAEDAVIVNDAAEAFAHDRLRAVAGQKWTRCVGKFCKICGLSKVKQMGEVTHNGETKPKDFGYVYQFALLGDAMSPNLVDYDLVISANPLDYLGMSFGHKWSSCHTIDKWNIRGAENNGSHTYSGMYSAGTLSYMLDPSTLIAYLVDPNDKNALDGNYELADKVKRCNFHYGNGFLVQGRVYPDSRDGGDTPNVINEMRIAVQGILSDCMVRLTDSNADDFIWVKSKTDTSRRLRNIIDEDEDKMNYSDYFEYSDCTLSYLKGKERSDMYYLQMHIGAWPMSVHSGEKLYDHHWIVLSDEHNSDEPYQRETICAHCGQIIEDGGDIVADDGTHFCSEQCAIAHGYVKAPDGEWIQKPSEEAVLAKNWLGGAYFFFDNEASAREADYVQTESGVWYHCNDTWMDSQSYQTYGNDVKALLFILNEQDSGRYAFYYFKTEENAEAFGFHKDANGDWVIPDEVEGTRFVHNSNSVMWVNGDGANVHCPVAA